MRIIELFAGIGACSKALKNIGISIEIIDAVEIDKFAIKSFNAIHNTNFVTQDIKKWDKEIKNIDLIVHGSPCQDFSVAGRQAGGDENSGTRSSLMFETLRIVGNIKPNYVVWENVKNILSKKHIHNFNAYLKKMEELGYKNYYKVLNAKDYNIPQNRERVFTISIKKDINKNFVFPEKQELKLRLKDMLEEKVEQKYYLDKYLTLFKANKNKITSDIKIAGIIEKNKWRRYMKIVLLQDSISSCLNTMQGGNTEPKVLINVNSIKIRKLTPRECWRLMGFTDKNFEKVALINSNAQLYKQAGNSIVVNVLEAIFRNLFK
ncbi:MAG: DNA cytosine methyltransferase [Bacilli bacterium]